jgi:LPXTG-motif cell wall-anchored protein
VGGEAYPVSKMSLVAPWIAVGVVLAGGAIWLAVKRRKARS